MQRMRDALEARLERSGHRRQVHLSIVRAWLSIHFPVRRGAVMTDNKYAVTKSVVLAATLVAGMSGVTRADDSSMSRFGGESYAYFNQPTGNALADSAWRQSHPNAHTQLQLQTLTSRSMSFQPPPPFTHVPPTPPL